MALTGLGVSLYGTYEWNKTKAALGVDKGMSQKDMEAMFHNIDKDDSGFIDEKELLAYLKEKKIQGVGPYEVHAMILAADETKDGKINFAEWKDLIKGTHEAAPLPAGKKMAPTASGGVAPKPKVDTHVMEDKKK